MPDRQYLTDEVRSLIGFTTPWLRAADPIDGSEIRRFVQATMDEGHVRRTVAPGSAQLDLAPLGFPMHAFRTPLDAQDPLAGATDADFDGYPRAMRPGLPALRIALKRIVNGGYEHEFFRHARRGEVIECSSCYEDIAQRQGRQGPMVLVRIRDRYRGEDGGPLLNSVNTMIFR